MCFLFVEVTLPNEVVLKSDRRIPGVLRCSSYPHDVRKNCTSIDLIRQPGHAAMISWLLSMLNRVFPGRFPELIAEVRALLRVKGCRLIDLVGYRWKFDHVCHTACWEVADQSEKRHHGYLIV